jgi:hypothetical protein
VWDNEDECERKRRAMLLKNEQIVKMKNFQYLHLRKGLSDYKEATGQGRRARRRFLPNLAHLK